MGVCIVQGHYASSMLVSCYPFNMLGHCFKETKRQVCSKPVDTQYCYSIFAVSMKDIPCLYSTYPDHPHMAFPLPRGKPGRGKPRLVGLSVADTEDGGTELLEDGHRLAVETRKRRKAHKAAK